ncbi:hypothetical protein ILYODFUR_024807 [Ilyodon furcidens]|uniref:Uncharacterized protein n=1 Tax=Ilyodon furcidens TaxID=33524 RepID=A0ABV0U9C0_9TELE
MMLFVHKRSLKTTSEAFIGNWIYTESKLLKVSWLLWILFWRDLNIKALHTFSKAMHPFSFTLQLCTNMVLVTQSSHKRFVILTGQNGEKYPVIIWHSRLKLQVNFQLFVLQS